MVPVDREIGAGQVAQQSGGNRLPHIGDVRRPAAVLVDGQLDPLLVGQLAELLADIQVEHEGLLAQHVFAGKQGIPDERNALGG